MTLAEQSMTRRVIVVPPELPLSSCWRIMKREGFRHLPIARGESVMGILSDRDVLARSVLLPNGEIDVPDTRVVEAMCLTLHVCQPSTPVSDLVRIMTENTIDAVVVVSGDNRLVGLVTSTDLLLLLIELEEAKKPLPFDFELETYAGGLT